jgi:CheY-like chemotaxis protein
VAPAPEATRPVPPPAPTPVRAAAPAGAPVSRETVVLDDGGAWTRASTDAHPIVALSPRDLPLDRLVANPPGRILANLTARGTLDALVKLRAAGCASPFWGCLAAPGADRGLPLGTLEVAVRPLDPEVVLAAVRGHATRGTRVLTAGADADALISLRQALAREGMSVSMAWDGKQASELLDMIRPEVVVVELDLPPRAGYGIVAQLAGRNPLPLAVLIPSGDEPAERFAALLGSQMYAAAFVPLVTLVAPVKARA